MPPGGGGLFGGRVVGKRLFSPHILQRYMPTKGKTLVWFWKWKKCLLRTAPPPLYTIRFQLEMALQTAKENAQSTQCTRISVNLCQGGHHRLLAVGQGYWEDHSRMWSVAGVVRLTSTVSLWSVWPAQDYYGQGSRGRHVPRPVAGWPLTFGILQWLSPPQLASHLAFEDLRLLLSKHRYQGVGWVGGREGGSRTSPPLVIMARPPGTTPRTAAAHFGRYK